MSNAKHRPRPIGGYADPSEVEGSDADKQAAFRKTLLAVRHRLELLINLPAGALDRLTLEQSARRLSKS